MPLPSFTVTGDLFNILGTVAGSALTADTLVGTVTFTPNVSSSEFVKWGGDLYRVSPVTARMSGAGLTYNGGPVKLLANDAGLSVTGLQWHAEITVKPDPGTGITRTMKDFWFDAPADGATVDLAAITPSVSVAVQGVAFTEGQLVALLSDTGSNVREALDALYTGGGSGTASWSTLTGKPAVIAAGADQAAARAVIGALSSTEISALITTATNNLLNGAPGALDTLKELADAINDDANFAATMTAALAGKVPTTRQVNGHALSADVTVTKSDVGLGSADNTADSSKPVSTAQQAALDLKAPLASPTFTGTVAGVTKAMIGLGSVDNTSNATERAAAAALTNKDLTSGTNTFPTLNQNTTGSAAKLTTARTINGVAFDGTANITVADSTKLAASAVVDNADGTVSVGSAVVMEPLTPAAAIVTASTAPAIGQITLYNAASGNLTPSLPALSGIAAGRRLAVRRDPADTSTNTVTFATNGADTFYSSGATSFTLPLAGEQREFQVVSVSGTKYWSPAGSLNPLPGLDARYQSAATAATKPNLGLPVSIVEDGVAVLVATANSTVGTSEEVLKVSVAASGLYVEYIHWQPDGTDPTAAIVINSSVKIGSTIYRVNFSGRTSAAIDPGGRVVSDKIGVSVLAGDSVGVRTYLASGTAYTPRVQQSAAAKGGFTAGVDLTAPGSTTIAASDGFAYGPAGLLGHTDIGAKSVYLLGDSILRGSGDGNFGASTGQIPSSPSYGMAGYAIRALTGVAGVVQASVNGDQASFAVGAAGVRRLGLLDRCTSGYIGLGHNDIYTGRTPAQLQADLIALARAMRRQGLQKVVVNTLTPSTTSTDGWATTTNQTVTTNNTNRVTHNNWVRAGCPVNASTLAPVTVGTSGALLAGSVGHPITGYLEVADTVESARDSGLWKAARRSVTTAAMTSGSNIVDAAGAAFNSALVTAGGDLASSVNVVGAGAAGATINSAIVSVNSATQIYGWTAASTTVSGATMAIGPKTVDGTHPTADGHILMAAAVNAALL